MKLSAEHQSRILLRLVLDLPEPRRTRWIKALVLAGELSVEQAGEVLDAG